MNGSSKENANKIIQIKTEVQIMKRNWWQVYKKGWCKHRDFWNRMWWIRFKFDTKSDIL